MLEENAPELDALGVKDHYVVIQPTARQLFKCWDNDKFSMVIDALQHRGYQVVLTCGPSADDLACVDEIARGCQTKPITGLAGKTRFPELGALIDHAVLFIGVDSAPGHIAAAVNTPVISLFGATDHVFWRPWTENIIQFWAGNYQKMPTRHELDRNKNIFLLFQRKMSLPLRKSCCQKMPLQLTGMHNYDRGVLLI